MKNIQIFLCMLFAATMLSCGSSEPEEHHEHGSETHTHDGEEHGHPHVEDSVHMHGQEEFTVEEDSTAARPDSSDTHRHEDGHEHKH